jgi:phosphonatase-like hydrolase
MKSLPKLVVFDMAGTTVRDEGGAVNRCLREALTQAGVFVTPEQVNEVMGIAKPLAIARLMISPSESRVAEVYANFALLMQDYYRTDVSVAPMPGAEALFARLRENNIKVALDTGFAREIIDVLLARLGWHDLVDATIGSDEVAQGRPHPDMICALMARLGIESVEHVAKVGDTPADLQEGANAGCAWNIGVTYGSHTKEELLPFPHTHLVDTMDELGLLLLGE